jgi:hypothetical protein
MEGVGWRMTYQKYIKIERWLYDGLIEMNYIEEGEKK